MSTDATQLTRIVQAIDIDVAARRVFEVLTDPNNISRYAGGIEGAEVVERDGDMIEGATLELVTKGNNILRATVLEAVKDRRLVVQDERGLRSTWNITDNGAGKVRLENVIEGHLPPLKAQALQYDADVKFQALKAILEGDAQRRSPGASDVVPSSSST